MTLLASEARSITIPCLGDTEKSSVAEDRTKRVPIYYCSFDHTSGDGTTNTDEIFDSEYLCDIEN